jgi:hypothetical protein
MDSGEPAWKGGCLDVVHVNSPPCTGRASSQLHIWTR